jgi:transposase
MWPPEHRHAANRNGLRYPSDLTDAERAIVEPMIPPARHKGRKRSVNVREVLNGIFYVLWTGCQWKALSMLIRRIKARSSAPICGRPPRERDFQRQ